MYWLKRDFFKLVHRKSSKSMIFTSLITPISLKHQNKLCILFDFADCVYQVVQFVDEDETSIETKNIET